MAGCAPEFPDTDRVGVLVSGGLDSAILVAELAGRAREVQPLYVRSGLVWEDAEHAALVQFLAAIASHTLGPLVTLDLPVADLYDAHWSVTGRGVPPAGSADEAVYLPGRNLLLLSKTLLWCHLHQVPSLALGLLGSNPFADATAAFFEDCTRVVNQAVGGHVAVHRPYAGLSKAEVLRRGRDLPLAQTLSCLRPEKGKHCGRCNKCAERRQGFAAAGLPDPTHYADG